ncbi:MAG: Bro-N domain-containing protein [Azoarcus sp.]|jgi:prophage antirepressor-like protein|nr:Bro-N domain-containing protein [Azoarcus sp.]
MSRKAQCCGFFVASCLSMGDRREEPQGSPCSTVTLTPVRSSTSISVGEGGYKTVLEHTTMATIATPGASAPAIFNFTSHSVRIVVRDDAPWFVASDVAEALEYRNAPDMTRFLDEDEIGTTHIVRSTQGGNPNVAIISESGMYHAVLKSRKPAAKTFRRWVTGEVLPAIRKTGRYESAAITTEQAGELFQLIAERFPEGSRYCRLRACDG